MKHVHCLHRVCVDVVIWDVFEIKTHRYLQKGTSYWYKKYRFAYSLKYVINMLKFFN